MPIGWKLLIVERGSNLLTGFPVLVDTCWIAHPCHLMSVISSFSYFSAQLCCSDAKDNSFTRSRSSSVTSIDRESREAICSFCFCESFPRKSDSLVSPCLLVGTTQGFVMMVALSLPPGGDQRLQQPVGIASCGKNLSCHLQAIDVRLVISSHGWVVLERPQRQSSTCSLVENLLHERYYFADSI